MNCITWNSRGTGLKAFPALVKDLVRKHNVGIFAILEPHCSGDKMINRIKKTSFQVSVRVDSMNIFGAI